VIPGSRMTCAIGRSTDPNTIFEAMCLCAVAAEEEVSPQISLALSGPWVHYSRFSRGSRPTAIVASLTTARCDRAAGENAAAKPILAYG
jgi:hypothetical protein